MLTVWKLPVIMARTVPSDDSIVLGQSVTVNCAAYGGERGYSYAVYYRKTGSATSYDILVTVKSADDRISEKTLSLTVTKS